MGFHVREEWILKGESALGEIAGIPADLVEPFEIHRKEFPAYTLHDQFSVLDKMLLVVFLKIRDLISMKDTLETPNESVLADKKKLIDLLDQIKGGLSYLFKYLELEELRRHRPRDEDS